MLKFGLMTVEGFGPIENIEFDWSLEGLNIIRAKNGTGKTKLINALVWACYGKTLSGSVLTWKKHRAKDYKGTLVCLSFTKDGVHYRVVRCKEYTGIIEGAKGKNRLLIYKEGKLQESDGKRESKESLSDIMGYSFDLFKNSIVFGQKLKRLVSETGPNKKKLLDEAFEVTYIAKALEKANQEHKTLLGNVTLLEQTIESLNQRIEQVNKEIEREKQLLLSFESDKQADIEGERIKIKALRKALAEDNRKLGELEGVSERWDFKRQEIEIANEKLRGKQDVDLRVALAYRDVKLLKGEISNASVELEMVPVNCSECGKPYTLEEREERINKLNGIIRDKTNKLKHIEEGISNDKNQLSSFIKLEEEVDILIKDKKLLEKQINIALDLNKQISFIKTQLKEKRSNITKIKAKTLPKNSNNPTRTLRELTNELEVKTLELSRVEKTKEDYKFLISGPLSNSGLKAFIFDQMLDSVNERLEYYAKFSGMNIALIVNMGSANKDIDTVIEDSKGEIVTYEELSGGQQQKVDIVTLFSLHDTTTITKDCSLLIMDELFESLDRDNIELLTDLIQDKSKNKNLYLITHRTEFTPTNSNIITLSTKEGHTSID